MNKPIEDKMVVVYEGDRVVFVSIPMDQACADILCQTLGEGEIVSVDEGRFLKRQMLSPSV